MTMPVAVTTITDPSGTAWVLDGSAGVWELTGKKGFHAGTYVHFRDESPAVDGAFWRGVRATVRDLFVPILFRGTDRNAVLAQRRNLIKAISPRNGQCTITSAWPDGSVRSIVCRYADGIEAGSQGPGEWGITAVSYGLHFVADDPYLIGPMSTTSWSLLVSTRTELPVPGADTNFEMVTSPQLISSITAGPINLNTTFETGVANWTATGGTASQDLVFFEGGLASAKIVPDGVTAIVRFDSDQQAVTPLTAYQAAGWLACVSSRAVALTVYWYNSSHVFISSSAVSLTPAAGVFTRLTGMFMSPFNAAYASVSPTLSGTPPATDILWADDVTLSQVGGAALWNPGDVSTFPTWTLTGPFTSITATQAETGKTWTIGYSAAAGDVLTLVTVPGRTSLVNISGANQWDKLNAGYQLWPLVPGTNTIQMTIAGATAASSAQLTFNPRYEAD
jgi:Phage tail protein